MPCCPRRLLISIADTAAWAGTVLQKEARVTLFTPVPSTGLFPSQPCQSPWALRKSLKEAMLYFYRLLEMRKGH